MTGLSPGLTGSASRVGTFSGSFSEASLFMISSGISSSFVIPASFTRSCDSSPNPYSSSLFRFAPKISLIPFEIFSWIFSMLFRSLIWIGAASSAVSFTSSVSGFSVLSLELSAFICASASEPVSSFSLYPSVFSVLSEFCASPDSGFPEISELSEVSAASSLSVFSVFSAFSASAFFSSFASSGVRSFGTNCCSNFAFSAPVSSPMRIFRSYAFMTYFPSLNHRMISLHKSSAFCFSPAL